MTVHLVGAGPGDAGLLTMRGAELLRRADAVVHDRLVHATLLELAPPGAEVYDVGKRPGARVEQLEINTLLVELGNRYPSGTVVRLKGGDPLVFGRGGEEALALQSAGLDFEIVPGVSAVNGVLAYAGIPLTHRGLSAAFTVVTGHGSDGSVSGGPVPVDWDALGRLGGTIVVLMGVEHRAEMAERLMRAGRSPSTPVAVIENGTLPGQATTRTTLGSLAGVGVGAPATVVIGDVVSLDLGWFANRPLFGWRVAITRTRSQASLLAAELREAGALPLEVPTIATIEPSDGGAGLKEAANRIADYRWVVFTSRNSVHRLLAHLPDARRFAAARIACIGEGTAEELAAHGLLSDLVPDSFVSEALAEAFPIAESPNERLLLPRAAVARDVLPETLRAKGYEVDIVEAYQTVRAEVSPALAEAAATADAVTFMSSSTVKAWSEAIGLDRMPSVVATIGPVTSETARSLGIEVTVEAVDRSVPGIVRALAGYAAGSGSSRPPGAV